MKQFECLVPGCTWHAEAERAPKSSAAPPSTFATPTARKSSAPT